MGTGTSEGIPRVSCRTNSLKTCPVILTVTVCTKAVEPGDKNRRLNTNILIRYQRPSGRCNILIDAGKFFYHSYLRWFPAFGKISQKLFQFRYLLSALRSIVFKSASLSRSTTTFSFSFSIFPTILIIGVISRPK